MALTTYQTPPAGDPEYRGEWCEPRLTVLRRVELFATGFLTAAGLIVGLWLLARMVVWVAGLAAPGAWALSVFVVGGLWGVAEAQR